MRGQAFDREQRLVLLRLHARGVYQTFAKIQKAANFEAEVRERLVSNGPWRRISHTSKIISYYDTYTQMDIAKVCSIAGCLLQLFAESFLRFYMRVPVTFVECVRAIADHVRAQADGLAAILARPFFGTRQQTLADTLRTEAFIYHQAADFGACVGFDRAIDEHGNPAGDLASFQFSHEYCSFCGGFDSLQAARYFFRSGGIAQLSG